MKLKSSILILLSVLVISLSGCGSSNVPPVQDTNQSNSDIKKSWLPAKLPPITDNSVFFPLNSKKVADTYVKLIKYNADYLVLHPKASVLLNSYTTENKDSVENNKLGQERINSVEDLLVGYGVKKSQISSKILQTLHPDNQKNVITKNQRVDIIYSNEAPDFYAYRNKPIIQM